MIFFLNSNYPSLTAATSDPTKAGTPAAATNSSNSNTPIASPATATLNGYNANKPTNPAATGPKPTDQTKQTPPGKKANPNSGLQQQNQQVVLVQCNLISSFYYMVVF